MIVLDHVTKVYPGGVKALDDVSLTIEKGEFIGIIGPSGAGKSTLIRTINRMTDITEGRITVDGEDISSLCGRNLRELRRRIGMIFQSFNLIPRTTVLKNVLVSFAPDMPFWKVLFGLYSRSDKVKALDAIENMGILDKAYSRCDELSGGQMQRVALARTLAGNPEMILADEPVASLDIVTARSVMDDLRRINRERGIPILVNIHNVDLALEYAERIIGIRNGRIVYDGKTADADRSVLSKVYGGEVQ